MLATVLSGETVTENFAAAADRWDSSGMEIDELQRTLSGALDENARLCRKIEESQMEFDQERSRLNAEIQTLQERMNNRLTLLLEPREKLMREEYERRFQDLTVGLRGARHKYTKQVEEMKQQMEHCICSTWRR